MSPQYYTLFQRFSHYFTLLHHLENNPDGTSRPVRLYTSLAGLDMVYTKGVYIPIPIFSLMV